LLPKEVAGLEIKEDSSEGISPVAYVSPGAFAAFKSALPALTCLLGHHTRPVQKGEGAEKEKEKEKEKDTKSVKEDSKKIEVKIREGRSVPTGHVWIGKKARKDLGLEGSYELLKWVLFLRGRVVLGFTLINASSGSRRRCLLPRRRRNSRSKRRRRKDQINFLQKRMGLLLRA